MNKHELWSAIWNAKQAIDRAAKLIDEFYQEDMDATSQEDTKTEEAPKMKQFLD